MKIITSLFVLLALIFSCKSTESLSKEQLIENLEANLKDQRYIFYATRANPMSGSSLHLTSEYTLMVKPDSIIAFLPYFGRAYSAPNPSEEGGIKFTSTDFVYSISDKEKGVYRVSVEIQDNSNNYKLSLLIGETGNGTLYVTQNNRQGISFYGNIR